MAIKPRVVYLGTATQNHQNNTPDTSSGLVSRLQLWGYPVFFASSYQTGFTRLFHMIWVVLAQVNRHSIVLIDTYSTKNFYGTVLLSWLIRLKRAPYIPILHGGNLPQRMNSASRLIQQYFIKAKALIAPSEYLAEVARAQNWPVQVIPNGLNLTDYPKSAPNPLTPIKPVLLWVRAFDHIYRPMLALKTLKILKQNHPEAELYMVGPDKDGSLAACKEFAKRHHLKVHFTGKLSKKQWTQRAAKASVFLNTSAIDNAPVSVVEAMALGLPVVSSTVGGLPYLIEHKRSGFLIPETEEALMATQFATTIADLLQGHYDLGFITDLARSKAALHDWSKVRLLWDALLR